MKNIVITLVSLFILTFVLSSCSDAVSSPEMQKDKAQQLYEKYKSMISEGDGCVPCVDCAALALAISYGTKDEIQSSKQKLIKYYKKTGSVPCPELVPELKESLAQELGNRKQDISKR